MSAPVVVQTSFLDLIAQSGMMAKLVLMVLLGASIICWAIIVAKWKVFRLAHDQNEKFMSIFWSGKNLDDVITRTEKMDHSPIASVFQQSIKELKKLSASDIDRSERIENLQRTSSRAASLEIAKLEKHVNWLATTASAAPFIGLFGTVWGIMNSFQNIGATGSANLAVVAPGISEALITTATGIAAAIPAVIAYNYFLGQVRKMGVDMDCFAQDFMNIVQRSVVGGRKEN